MSADFYLGTTIGMVLALILILAVVFKASAKKPSNGMEAANELLRERNEIGEKQAFALQEIQCVTQQAVTWYAHYLNKEKEAMRDRFAGMALQGILAQPLETDCLFDPYLCAESAYEHADAMLAARERKEGA
jgi:uncharacterized membrane protein